MRKDNKMGIPRNDPNYQKEYRKKNPEKFRKWEKTWREKHPERYKKKIQRHTSWMRKYRFEHPEERCRKAWEKRKLIFELLGNKCCQCGESDWRCLQIDHVKGGGNKQKVELCLKGEKYLNFILKELQSGSKDYQLLCANCNWKKVYRNNEIQSKHILTITKVMGEKP